MPGAFQKYFQKPALQDLRLQGWKSFVQRGALHGILDAIRSYTKLQTENLDAIPKTGPVIVVPNHSGVFGWDGMVLQNEILKKKRRIPRTMLHNFWFNNPQLRIFAEKLAFIPQDFKKALRILRKNNVLLLFPEAEAGNFKPSTQMYQLQSFNPGFVSLAVLTGAVIVPCCIIGAEEAHLNLGSISWAEKWLGTKIPLPFNLLPFPVKWKLVFLDSISLKKYERRDAKNEQFLIETAENIRMRIQKRISQELRRRKLF